MRFAACTIIALMAAASAATDVKLAERATTAAGTGSHDDNAQGDEKVYLRSITSLIFSENARAKSRKGLRRPQLLCTGGSASGFFWKTDFYPHMVRCQNAGWDGGSIQWTCEADLQDGLQFGPQTEVLCEGYDKPGSDYVLRGSCRLEYTLNYSSFQLSSVHIIYGSILGVGLLWFYYQSRFWVHRAVKKREMAAFAHLGDAPHSS